MLAEAGSGDALAHAIDGLYARLAQGALRADDVVTLADLPQAKSQPGWD